MVLKHVCNDTFSLIFFSMHHTKCLGPFMPLNAHQLVHISKNIHSVRYCILLYFSYYILFNIFSSLQWIANILSIDLGSKIHF